MKRLLVIALLVASSAHADRLFITNERGGTLTVIDTASNKVLASIDVGTRPRGIVASPDGKRLYIALSHFRDKPRPRAADGVVAVDTSTLKIVQRYSAGTDPEGIALTADGSRFIVSNEDAGTASIVDTKSGKTIATLVVGTEPEGAAVSRDGRWAYITAETSNTISVIDLRLSKVVANIMVDARPRAAIFARDGLRAYATAEVAGSVSAIDPRTNRVLQRIRLGGAHHPVGLVLSPDEKRIYVATGRGNSVAVIDTAAFRLLGAIPVGQRPWGIAVSRDGSRLFTANGLSNDVSVIDTASNKVVATIKAGDGPWGVVALK